jgi:predicted transcriptional regulator
MAKHRKSLFFKLAIILPILSILIGYFGVKWFFIDDLEENEENVDQEPSVEAPKDPEEDAATQEPIEETPAEEATPNKTDEYSFRPLNFYSIQMGSFTTQANADTFKNELVSKGLAAFTIKNDGNVRVYAYIKNLQDGLAVYIPKTAKEIEESFIKSVEVSPGVIHYPSENEDIHVIKEVNEILVNNFYQLIEKPGQRQVDLSINNLESALNQLKNIEFQEKNLQNIDTELTNLTKNSISYLSSLGVENNDSSIQNYLTQFAEQYSKIN